MRAVIIITLLAGYILCQDFEIELQSFNTSNDQILSFIREKCITNGGEEAFETLKLQPFELNSCLGQHFNYSAMQAEIEESKKTGSMDEVFTKYCNRYPHAYKCLQQVNVNVAPCLDLSEQHIMNSSLEFLESIKIFLCNKEGNNMAVFVAKGGVECLQTKMLEFQECFNQNMSLTDLVLIPSLPRSEVGEKECNNLHRTEKCFLKIVETCTSQTYYTIGNLVEAFFRYIRKEFDCNVTVKEYSIVDFRNNENLTRVLLLGVACTAGVFLIYQLLTRRFYIYKSVE